MSARLRIRTGDVVIPSTMADAFEVRIIDTDHVRCRHLKRPQNKRFRLDDLEEVDEGVWQEFSRG